MDKTKTQAAKEPKKDIPSFRAGDIVEVAVRIMEEGKTRIQPFQGIVIRRKGSGVQETFTVRRVSYGEGLERIFPLQSPNVTKIKIIKRGKVRRAKLYYLREKIGKKAKVAEKEGPSSEGSSSV